MTSLLFVDQHGGMGGGQRILMALLRAALKAEFRVAVLAPGGGALQTTVESEFAGRITFVSCELPRLRHGRKGWSDLLALLSYGWRFRRHLPLLAAQDVIYVNGLRHLPHLLLLTRKLRARLVYHVHLNHSRPEKLLLRLAIRARNTFRLVVNSRYIRDMLDISSPRVLLIENALDAAFAERPFVDRFTGCGARTATILGTVRREKGQDIAIAALKARPDITLHIIGPIGAGAEGWAKELKGGVTANIHFHEAVRDIAQSVDTLGIQINLVPSRWEEPFGLVAIEGMACSCLTIVSGRGGLAEIADNTGALVAPDAESLRNLLDELLARPAAALAELAKSQHEKTLARYHPERFEAEIAALLATAAQAASAAPRGRA
jgi:glycosyltransferase involved in cell wall biosynthesis